MGRGRLRRLIEAGKAMLVSGELLATELTSDKMIITWAWNFKGDLNDYKVNKDFNDMIDAYYENESFILDRLQVYYEKATESQPS